MLFGKAPWVSKNEEDMVTNIKKMNLVFDSTLNISDVSKDVLRKMLNINPD